MDLHHRGGHEYSINYMYYIILKPILDHHDKGVCQGVCSKIYTELLSWLPTRVTGTSKPESRKIEYIDDVILAKQKIRQL